MADRYWVGGTANWDNTAGSKWATSSGGTGGAAVPTSSDDVYFDANSGAVTCTINVDAYCINFNLTGYTGTIDLSGALNTLRIDGSITIGSGATFGGTGNIRMHGAGGTPATRTITSNGVNIDVAYLIVDSGVHTVSLVDAFTSTGYIWYMCGVLDGNNQNIEMSKFLITDYGTYFNTKVLNMGSGTWTLTDYGWNNTAASINLTLNEETSTIKYTGANNTNFVGTSETYYNLWQAGTGILTITGSNTFNDLKADTNTTTKVTGGTTQTITTLTMVGTSGNLVTLKSTNTTNFTLSDGAGTNDCDYLDIAYCTASGGATFQVGYNSLINNIVGWDETGFTNPTNAYADDASYATGNSTSGVTSVSLSWDGGTTYTSLLDQTLAGEATKTYGAGSTELWGRSWVGDDVDDTSFRVKITFAGGRYQIYKTFGFAPGAAVVLSGIEVTINGLYSSSVTSIDHLAVKIYYGSSSLPVQAGSQAYASDGRKAGEGAAAGTGVLVFNDGTNWIACDTGAAVAA